MKIGFIGLGIMGAPMAGHLIAGGHQAYVQTRSKVPAEITEGPLPLLLLRPHDARAAEAALRARRVHVGAGRLREGVLVVNPLALDERDLTPLAQALRHCCATPPAPASP